MRTRPTIAAATAALTLSCAPAALAQFSDQLPPSTGFGEILSGDILTSGDGPTPAVDDEFGAFFNDQVVGAYTLTEQDAQNGVYGFMTIIGNDPGTAETEGPEPGDTITFRFFDASTNSVFTNVQSLNEAGEVTNHQFQGGELVTNPFPVPGLPPVLGTNRAVDLRLGAGDGNGGGNGGGGNGGGDTGGDPDVDGDGEVTHEDAAIVLRVVVGGTRTMTEAQVSAADVNGDGSVTTDDAIAVIRARQGR